MKKLTLSLMALAISVATFANGEQKGGNVYSVAPATSSVVWTGKKVTGSHTGNVSVKQGNLVLENGQLKSAYVQVDMTTITCSDLTDRETNAKLVGHLKSDDFFSVNTHQFSEINITEFTPTTNKGEYTAKGTLKIKGKTEAISFPFTFNEANGTATASGKLTFDRSKYDVRYGSTSFFDSLGDKAIYDNVELEFTIKAQAKK
jgi:polyisoprenoid-binding protein YceI